MDISAFSLQNQVAIVTGAGKGIGLEVSRMLCAAGAFIVVAEINPQTGKAAASELEGDHFALDVTDSQAVSEMVRAVLDKHEKIDILVNNAGIVENTLSEETSDSDWRSVMSVNLDGVFWCCREVGRVMLRQNSGVIINVASMSGIISNRPQSQAAYNTSKAGVIMLTKSLAGEWADRGVRVNSVAPGYVRTSLTEHGLSEPDMRNAWLSSTPIGRMAKPEEIAPAVLYLASGASSFTTGSNLVVDGGYTVW